jgi:hypothetical protein
MKFNIKKQGNFFVAFDLIDKKRSYGKINIKTGKFTGDTRCLAELSDFHYSYNDTINTRVIARIEKDIKEKDLTALDELLNFIPIENRLGYLPEERVYYQPELSVTEWESGKLASFQVYRDWLNAKKDYPNHNIIMYSGNDIEQPTFVD